MNEIFFLFFAFLTVFLSVKISYYADSLSKTSGISGALIGGIVLAGVTSLPEFVTCFSAILVGNPLLATGDVLGSNLFNLFMVCFFDLVFLRKMIFTRSSRSHNLVLLLLVINYIVLYLFVLDIFSFSFLTIGVPSLFIFISYLFYIKSISKYDDSFSEKSNNSSNAFLKLIVSSILMIMSSVCLTVIVNNLSIIYPSFSSGFLGAIFLGVTTSLPEVITFYTLINLDNYDLAISNILGSNLFNLLVLSIGDLLFLKNAIYNFVDSETRIIVVLGLCFSLLCLWSNNRKNVYNGFSYGILSFLVVFAYLFFWIFNFCY